MFLVGLLLCLHPAWADVVVTDDQIVLGSMCVGGVDCVDGEFLEDPMAPTSFNFDTIRIKSTEPQIRFDDTSNSAAFPTNDWLMGIADDMATGSPFFFITDESSGLDVLLLQAADTGGVALGAGSAIVAGAVSVGAPGTERSIVNLAAGTDDTDAVNMQQFADFQANTNSSADAMAIEAEVAAAQVRIDDLNLRVDDLLMRVDDLQNPSP